MPLMSPHEPLLVKSRLADAAFGGGAFGNLPGNTDFGALLTRARRED